MIGRGWEDRQGRCAETPFLLGHMAVHGNTRTRRCQISNRTICIVAASCEALASVGYRYTEPEFRERLSELSFGHSTSPGAARKRYHSLMALRCFRYIKTSYAVPTEHDFMSETIVDVRSSSSTASTSIALSLTNDDEVLLVAPDDDVSRIADSSISTTSMLKCAYPTRYLFEHLSQGFPDAVQELSEDDPDFWGGHSTTRDRWLEDFQLLTTNFGKDLNISGMSTLHVAAGIGANDLVSILIDRNGKESSAWTNTDGMTAVSASLSRAIV
jgi:hypothetical protein